MSENSSILRIPPRVMEGIMNEIGASVVIQTHGSFTDTYRGSGNEIQDTTFPWKDTASCRNGALPTDAQIQAALRAVPTTAQSSNTNGNQTTYNYDSRTSPLTNMCEVALRTNRPR